MSTETLGASGESSSPISLPTSTTAGEQPKSAHETQIGGDHYKKLAIQPYEYAMANKLDLLQGNIVKYVTRFRDKGGIQDLEKAKHSLELLIEWEHRE